MRVLFILLWLFLIVPEISEATTYYIDDTGNNANTCVQAQTPSTAKATFVNVFTTCMVAGDTLIVRDGTYNQQIIDPPNGTSGAYTIIKAENDGAAILDCVSGCGTYPNGPIVLGSVKSYIQIEGFLAKNGGETVVDVYGSNIKIMRVGAKDASTSNTFAVVFSFGGSSNLLEDIWGWGEGRYIIEMHGNGNTVRRAVIRWDNYTVDTQPKAGLIFYDATNSTVENVVALNFDVPGTGNISYAAFYNKGSAANNKVLGSIAVDVQNFLAGYWLSEDATGTGNTVTDSVAWDAGEPSGDCFRIGAAGGVVNRSTCGSTSSGTAYSTGGGTVKNSVMVSSGATVGVTTNNYNIYFNTTPPSGHTNSLITDPNKIHMMRVEVGSTGESSGEGGVNRGAHIINRYQGGVLIGSTLWPWPNEARIKTEMCSGVTRGWCGTAKTLTDYLWSYLGTACPTAICSTGDVTAPSIPTGLTVTPVSSSQLNLSWTASTDNVGVTGYQVDRCQGSGCASFVQIATSSLTSYSDVGLLVSTLYRYRVRAVDAVPNVSGNSSIAEGTTSVVLSIERSTPKRKGFRY